MDKNEAEEGGGQCDDASIGGTFPGRGVWKGDGEEGFGQQRHSRKVEAEAVFWAAVKQCHHSGVLAG